MSLSSLPVTRVSFGLSSRLTHVLADRFAESDLAVRSVDEFKKGANSVDDLIGNRE